MADTSNRFEHLAGSVGLSRDGWAESPYERTKSWLESESKWHADVAGAGIDNLKAEIARKTSQDEKMVAILIQAEGGEVTDKIKRTRAWKSLVASGLDHQFLHETGSSHEHHEEAADLKREIDLLKQKPAIKSNPFLLGLIAKIESEVSRGRSLPEMAEALAKLREWLDKPDMMSTIADITSALQNFEKTDIMTMPEEGKVMFFTVLVQRIYALGGRMTFLSNDDVQVTWASWLADFTSSCKKTTKEWLKKGLILNSTQAWPFMSSMWSDTTKLTVDTLIRTRWDFLQKSGSPVDQDILNSSEAGWYDVMENGTLKRAGFNVSRELQTTQDAIDKWRKIGIVSPMQKLWGAGVQFADLAYNVVRAGFVVGTMWKGTKAIFKTIFGDDASMKAAWWEFGKTAAITAGVWYGGEFVKRTANTIADRSQNGEFEPIVAGASPHHPENMWAIWDMVGGGIIPERFRTQSLLDSLAPSTVKWEVFRPLITDFFLDKNWWLANVQIQDLADAVWYRDHTPVGSHAWNIRNLLRRDDVFGPDKGEEMYLRYFGNTKVASDSYKILRAIVGYRASGPDAIADRRRPVWDLFAEPLQHEVEVPADFGPSIEKIRKSWSQAGYEVVKLWADVIAFAGDGVHVIVGGVEHVIHVAEWILKDPANRTYIEAAIAALGAVGLTVGAVTALSFIPGVGLGMAALKTGGIIAAVAGGGYVLWNVLEKQWTKFDSPQKIFDFLINSKYIPDTAKASIRWVMGTLGDTKVALENIANNPAIMSLLPDSVQKIIKSGAGLLPSTPTVPLSPGGGPPTWPKLPTGGGSLFPKLPGSK